jgi:lipopolysaccharide/colanic/teichoic acid biosynthesis glycosyltransferase
MVIDDTLTRGSGVASPYVQAAPEPHVGYDFGKRIIDVAGATALLVVGAPFLAAAAVAIKLTSPGPLLFRQQRMGRGGEAFSCLKLRTMVQDAEAKRAEVLHLNTMAGPAFKLPDDPRLTKVGKFLRSSSIDELPQAINILRGEMSLVGPRPLPLSENRYQGDQVQRLSVKPGLTCIWQISGRSSVTFDQWMELDLDYVRHRSISKDLSLIARTIPAVLSKRGAV